jgi:hypothetical protein
MGHRDRPETREGFAVIAMQWTALAGIFCDLETDDGHFRRLQVCLSELGELAAVFFRPNSCVRAGSHVYQLNESEFYHVEVEGLSIMPRADDTQGA